MEKEISEINNAIANIELKIDNIENHHWRVFFHSPDDKIYELAYLRRVLAEKQDFLKNLKNTENETQENEA